MKMRKIGVAGLALALVATAQVAQPAQAASTDLVIGSVLDIDKLDPHTATNFATVRALGLVYSGLVEVAGQNKISPALATSWQFNSNGTSVTLNLRPNVKFHDGTTFDALDVKASIE